MTAPQRPTVTLTVVDGELAVCRLPPDASLPSLPDSATLLSITRTRDELSIVCPAAAAPPGARVEPGWRALVVHGPLDFGLTGILASLAGPLADRGIPLFAVSTYDTDYVLVAAAALDGAVQALRDAGHVIASPAAG